MDTDTEPAPAPRTRRSSAEAAPDAATARVVLACVQPGDLPAASRILAESGLRIRAASGWTDALSVFRELRPAAVLLDSSFLEGAGPQLCAALRRTIGLVETPVLALCGGRREVARALEAGASDVVDKPLDWRVVARRLDALVRGFLAANELERTRRQAGEAQRKVAEAWERLEQKSRIDALTGLPNRLHLERLLERALLRTGQGSLAVLILDIDRFTELNETLGRRGGDEILRRVAERLSACLRDRPGRGGAAPGLAAVARLGGDEFTLMLSEGGQPGPLERFARSVLDVLGAALDVGGTQVYLSASIGIAIASGAETDAGTLLQHADTALFAAKRRGGGQSQLYSEALAGETEARLAIDRRLRRAFERDELSLDYQPLVEAGSRRVLGVEALLRWKDGERGFIPPSDFIPIAEDTGLMAGIGAWVLSTACRQLRAWLDEGLPPIRVAVNVSRCQLERGDFAAEVERTLADTGLDPGLLELELSERGALRTDPTIVAQLRRIKALGVRLVVDDFGTGQSAIAHLRQFGLDGLKIDRSFIRGITEDGGDDATITAAVTAMARRLGLAVVAEGVETEAELAKVKECGCEAVQGFLFSRPVAADTLRGRIWLHDGHADLDAGPGAGPPTDTGRAE